MCRSGGVSRTVLTSRAPPVGLAPLSCSARRINYDFVRSMNARQVFTRLSRGALFVVYLLVVLELATRLLLHIGPIFRTVVGRDDSSSGRLLWVRRHSEEGGFAAQYRFDVYDPIRGWAVMPNV